MIASICSEPKILEVMRLVNIFINIIRIVVPILLIFTLIFKFAKATINDDKDNLQKVLKTAPSNIVAAVIIFLVPIFVSLIVKVSFPNSDYNNCISIRTIEQVNEIYENKIESLISKAEETLELYDYSSAYNYLNNIKNEDKRVYYEEKLKNIKEQIDAKSNNGGKYAKINFSDFRWSYYKKNEGPLTNYLEKFNSYAIWGPDDPRDLNNVSLPLIIWLHGMGERGSTESVFLNRGLLKVMTDWSSYGLKPVPAIIVAPQSKTAWGGYPDNYNIINGLIKYTADYYNIDRSKIVLMGHSMGGNGAVELSWEMKNLNLYAIVTMSIEMTSYNAGNGTKEFFSNIRMRGYSEFGEHQQFYNWIGQPNNFTYYKGEKHANVPQRAMTEDLNNDGISDLVYWLFGDNITD